MISLEAADTIEIIHTNPHSQSNKPLGHIDFFINGGSSQPNCPVNDDECLSNRAIELYVETLPSNSGFYGRECSDSDHITLENCQGKAARMGGLQKKIKSTGVFYVHTNEKPPYLPILKWRNPSLPVNKVPVQTSIAEDIGVQISCGHKPSSKTFLLKNMENLDSSCFKTKYETVIFTHGWRDSSHLLASTVLRQGIHIIF